MACCSLRYGCDFGIVGQFNVGLQYCCRICAAVCGVRVLPRRVAPAVPLHNRWGFCPRGYVCCIMRATALSCIIGKSIRLWYSRCSVGGCGTVFPSNDGGFPRLLCKCINGYRTVTECTCYGWTHPKGTSLATPGPQITVAGKRTRYELRVVVPSSLKEGGRRYFPCQPVYLCVVYGYHIIQKAAVSQGFQLHEGLLTRVWPSRYYLPNLELVE